MKTLLRLLCELPRDLLRDVSDERMLAVQDMLRRLGEGALHSTISADARDGVRERSIQDHVEAALRLRYDDVRREEPTPSFAGTSSRIDFLVPAERLAIEVKVASRTRTGAAIRREILVDINDYARHPEVEHIMVVVYDLMHAIPNHRGFEKDLRRRDTTPQVRVVVASWIAATGRDG